jgi:hypothetical protein
MQDKVFGFDEVLDVGEMVAADLSHSSIPISYPPIFASSVFPLCVLCVNALDLFSSVVNLFQLLMQMVQA